MDFEHEMTKFKLFASIKSEEVQKNDEVVKERICAGNFLQEECVSFILKS